MGPVGPPVPAARARLLRRAVIDHARTEHRRRYPPLLHLGLPGGPEVVLPAVTTPDDLALRVEVLAAALRRVGALRDPDDPGAATDAPLAWLTRSGELDRQDVDAAWLAAVRTVAGELGDVLVRPPGLVVVNRRGWLDLVTGSGRRWRRIRPG